MALNSIDGSLGGGLLPIAKASRRKLVFMQGEYAGFKEGSGVGVQPNAWFNGVRANGSADEGDTSFTVDQFDATTRFAVGDRIYRGRVADGHLAEIGIVTSVSATEIGVSAGIQTVITNNDYIHNSAFYNISEDGEITLGTGATAFSPASNVLTVGTANTEVVRVNANAGIILNNGLLSERIKIDSDSINSDKFIRLQDGMVHYRSSAVGAAGVKPDIVSTTGINTDMAIGDTIAVTLITVAGNTSHYVSSVAIDGRTTGISTYWTGGSTPDAGGGSNVDIYAFNILKTADNTFTVIANQTLTSA